MHKLVLAAHPTPTSHFAPACPDSVREPVQRLTRNQRAWMARPPTHWDLPTPIEQQQGGASSQHPSRRTAVSASQWWVEIGVGRSAVAS
mmetsp:Transcript_16893/g.53597  ORF Transcript_16893/g.53597 Transcript_16893/m.53597 type:complete len:89 (-) Transcript_16893:382-648(-)